MAWLDLVSYFFGGMLLANAVPHFVSGITGRPFQTPFATPSGKGLSSSTVNMLWGLFNLLVGYVLTCYVGQFDLRNSAHAGSLGLGIALIGLFGAHHFGRLHGGDLRERP